MEEDRTVDEGDAGVFRTLSFLAKKSDKSVPTTPTSPVRTTPCIPAMNEDYYNMNHAHRGVALIFNHYRFDDPEYSCREGTNEDADRLKKTLKGLGFTTLVKNDFTVGQTLHLVDQVARMDHTDNDCVLVAVMTHGDPDILHAKDKPYHIDALWKSFTGNNCPSLVGKPKIFIIQACRGDQSDPGTEVEFDTRASYVKHVKIPTMADFIFMYPTMPGHFSFRSPRNGSWMIQALCAELAERAHHQDLATILTFVNRHMAFGFASNVPSRVDLHDKKQVGQIVNSLTRLVQFNKMQKQTVTFAPTA